VKSFDFELLLFVLTAATGVCWAWHALSKRRIAFIETLGSFFFILLFVFLLRGFLVEPFRIPSGSMKPTFLDGDFILVNKFIYGIRLPVVHTKVLNITEPKRGDVLVFRYPEDPSIPFIKRVIGVPGDKISYENKTLYINGQAMAKQFLGDDVDKDSATDLWSVKRYEEDLLGAKPHAIFLRPGEGRSQEPIEVPAGHYFVMGDNRDNSEDSRKWGFVPEANIMGKAFFIWLSWDSLTSDFRFSRMFKPAS